MSEEILINSTPTESRVAMVENGVVQEVWMDRASHRGYLGNVYKGTVSRVLPGMQAAFINIGLDRTAFLHASDIHKPERPTNGSGGEPLSHDQTLSDEIPPISSLLHERSELVVQIIKDPIGSKGARLTTNLSIPSRFLVLLPGCDTIAVSVRIEDEDERQRLTELVKTLRVESENCGYIVRTNAEGVSDFALSADMAYLRKVWQAIDDRTAQAVAPECIYEDLSMPLKALRDQMHGEVESVRIDSKNTYGKVLDFTRRFIPDWSERIRYYDSDRPIFDLYGIEDEINQALHKKTPLKSGGHLVIDQTEALITVDVNTGGFVGSRTQEETVYKTNLEAAQAIARQLRLRNLGGIIIIDFIDMTIEEHRQQVLKALEKALAKDHAKTSVNGISDLGLVEMTRKRSTESLGQVMCQPCPECQGIGHIKSAETVCLEVFREIMRSGRQFEASKLLVIASSEVVNNIRDEQSVTIAELEELIGKPIRFKSEDQYTQEQFDVVLL